jgi:hypothetical protein
MRYRWGLLIALVVSGCSVEPGQMNPTATTPASTPPISVGTQPSYDSPTPASPEPTLELTPSAPATPTPWPWQTPVPSGVKPTATMQIDPATLTLICRTNDRSEYETEIDLAGAACRQIIDASLAVLGRRAKDVVRVQAGSICAAPCTDRVYIGFKDGHLEGAAAFWEETDGQYEPSSITVAPFHPVAASVWPWADAATFDSPPVARPALPIPALPELTNRTPLPYCGLETGFFNAPDATARRCFVNAVLTGHPAELMAQIPHADDKGMSVALVRFSGHGPVVEYYSSYDGETQPTRWTTEPSVMHVGRDDYLFFLPIPPYGFI